MKKTLNSFIAACLAAIMIVGGWGNTALAAADDGGVILVSDLTRKDTIGKTGAAASADYTKSGDFTLKISGNDLYREIQLPVRKSDISDYKFLEFWVYSANNIKTRMTLGAVSDNSETTELDYYFASFNINKYGWQKITLCYDGERSSFTNNGKPVGWDRISELRLWPSYGGTKPEEGTELYFDRIVALEESETFTESVVAGDSEAASGGGYGEGPGEAIVFDFSNRAGAEYAGGVYSDKYSLSGEGARYYCADNYNTKKWENILLPADAPKDWSGYKYMQMSIYSENVSGEGLEFYLLSENPETTSSDGYHYDVPQTWSGWNIVTLEVGRFPWYSPLGTHDIQRWQTRFNELMPNTELYIDRVWLTNTPSPELASYEVDYTKDYIPASDDRYQERDNISVIKQRYPNQKHPRLILDEEGFENLKKYIAEVPYLQTAYNNELKKANNYLETPVSDYMYYASQTAEADRASMNMLYPLAIAYKISGDERYKDRLWAELEHISTWQPMTLLDELGNADHIRPIALCYDWLYNDWTEEQRQLIRTMIAKNYLEPVVPSLLAMKRVFAGAENHCLVVNSGVGMGALALADEPGYEKYCNQIINATIESMRKALSVFKPDGVSAEGLDYFEYGQDGPSLYFAALRSSLGNDLGVDEIEGRSKMGNFVVAVNGSVQSFDFSDSYPSLRTPSELLFLADVYHDEGLAAYTIQNCASSGSLDIRDLLYFRDWMKDAELGDYQRDFNLRSDLEPVASMRSTYENDNAAYLGFKGGKQMTHGDLDYGSFVFDSMGIRWFHDSGIDNYDFPGMFNYAAISTEAAPSRWRYYTKRAEGHNTFVINPLIDKGDLACDQDIEADVVNIDTFETDEDWGYGIMNMTHVYTPRVASAVIDSARRGIGLIKNRSTLIIQDEIKSAQPMEVYSYLHTMADIQVQPDKKSAVLTQSGKKMKVTLLGDGELLAMEAKSLIAKYNEDVAHEDTVDSKTAKQGLRKLAVHVKNAMNPTLAVVVQPLYDGVDDTNVPVFLPLDSWSGYSNNANNKQLVKGITVGGIPIGEFRSGNTQYVVESNIAEVKAEAAEGAELKIVQAQAGNPFAYVYAKQDNFSTVYRIEFKEKPRIYKASANIAKYPVVNIECEDVPQPENGPENSIDNNFGSRWAAEGDCSIIWDLGEVKPIKSVMLSFWKGGERRQIFDLEISDDKQEWREVFSGLANGAGEDLENIDIGETHCRYIRFKGHGTSAGTWTSVLEFVAVEYKPIAYKDVLGHWAEDTIKYMAEQGLVNGVSDTAFNPEGNITYAEGITLLCRLLGMEVTDNGASAWYENYISTAEANGLIPESWYNSGVLDPDKQLTREEMCMLLVNAYSLKNSGRDIKTYNAVSIFDDINQASPDGKEAIDKCLTLRLVNGKSANSFAPKANITRAEATTVFERLYLLIN